MPEFQLTPCESQSLNLISKHPIAYVPLGYTKRSGRPYSLQAVAATNQKMLPVKFTVVRESFMRPGDVAELLAYKKPGHTYKFMGTQC